MDVQEVKEKLNKLNRQVYALIDTFQKETDTIVSSVDYRSVFKFESGQTCPNGILDIKVQVEK